MTRNLLGFILACVAIHATISGVAKAQGHPFEIPYPTERMFAVPNASAAVSTRFVRNGLEFDGVQPGRRLIWFATARERVRSMYTRILRRKGTVVDDNADGKAELDFGKPIPSRSIWVVADPARNEVQVVSPRGILGGVFEASALQLSKQADRILSRGTQLDALWLRPNVGSWYASFRDGGPNDADGRGNREIRARLRDFEPQFPSDKPPPNRPRAGDIFVVVAQPSHRVAIVEVQP